MRRLQRADYMISAYELQCWHILPSGLECERVCSAQSTTGNSAFECVQNSASIALRSNRACEEYGSQEKSDVQVLHESEG